MRNARGLDQNRCRFILPMLPDWTSGRLERGEKARIEQHLAQCSDCRAAAVGWRRIESQLAAHYVQPVAMPSDLSDRINAAVAAAPGPSDTANAGVSATKSRPAAWSRRNLLWLTGIGAILMVAAIPLVFRVNLTTFDSDLSEIGGQIWAGLGQASQLMMPTTPNLVEAAALTALWAAAGIATALIAGSLGRGRVG